MKTIIKKKIILFYFFYLLKNSLKNRFCLLQLFLHYRGFFPVVINFLRRVPVLGNLFLLPGISTVSPKNLITSSPESCVTVEIW